MKDINLIWPVILFLLGLFMLVNLCINHDFSEQESY